LGPIDRTKLDVVAPANSKRTYRVELPLLVMKKTLRLVLAAKRRVEVADAGIDVVEDEGYVGNSAMTISGSAQTVGIKLIWRPPPLENRKRKNMEDKSKLQVQ
jgi:hypothetical protein